MKKFLIILLSMLLFTNTAFTQNCDSVANLSVDYTEDCKAVITWDMPSITSTDMLWDNTAGVSQGGCISSRWMVGDERKIIADDFDIPTGVTWSIEEVIFRGFYLSYSEPPNYIGVEIYTDNGNKPGTRIYEEPYLTPNEYGFQGIRSVTLPEPFEITEAGKYWISIYGTYETEKDETYHSYYIFLCSVPAGAPVQIYQYNNWGPIEDIPHLPSMYFSIKGSKEGKTEPIYNIYRDSDLIATLATETSYTDGTFDANQEHTWIVKMICETGGESEPVEVKATYGYEGIDDIPLDAFIIHPNPTTGELTIDNGQLTINNVEVFDVYGRKQKIILNSPLSILNSINISHLSPGIYFVKIVTEQGEVVKKVVKQ